nr:hypothetical protein OG409_35785 [Streptomyces sp. NBC_00974]
MVAADYTFDVFIAFAPEDTGAQRTVRRILDEGKVRTEAIYGETALDFHPEQIEPCRNFLLLATRNSAASPYVRDQVAWWREHRDMRSSFYILDVSGDTLRSSRTGSKGWYDLLHIDPYDPRDQHISAIWPFAQLDSPHSARQLASLLKAGGTPKPTRDTPATAPRPAPTTHRMRPRTLLITLLGILLPALLTTAWISTRSLLESHQQNGLGPTDAPAAVASIVSIGTVIGVLIGGTLTGLAKLIQARGQKDADLVRANAEMVRAQAEMIRARAGLPPIEAAAPAPLPAPRETEQPAEPPAL